MTSPGTNAKTLAVTNRWLGVALCFGVVLHQGCGGPAQPCVASAECPAGLFCTNGVCTTERPAGTGGGAGTGGSGARAGAGGSAGQAGTGGAAGSGGVGGFPGESCQSAVLLSPPVQSRIDSTQGFANTYDGGTGCVAMAGVDRVYRVAVPSAQQLTARVVGNVQDAGFDPSINLVVGPAAQCDAAPLVCSASSDTGSAGTVNLVRHANVSGVTQDVFLIVDALNATATGPFSLSVSLGPAPAQLQPGASCSSPASLTIDRTVLGTTATLANGFVPTDVLGCEGVAAGTAAPDGVYALQVPAGATLVAELTTSWDAVLNLVESPASTCGSGGTDGGMACLAGTDGVTAGTERLSWKNGTSATKGVFLLVDGYQTTSAGSFELSTWLE